MGKRNPMLNTEDGRERYYAYQARYRKEHVKHIQLAVSSGKDAKLIEAIESLPSKGRSKNGYIREAIVEKLIRDGYLAG